MRAITLAGGGPAAGLHIGVLEGLQNADPRIKFDVWALSCIGAWVGIIYNQWETGDKAEKTFQFFRNNIFRDDDSYSRFPINTVFGPDLGTNASALIKFLSAPDSYDKLFLGRKIADAFTENCFLVRSEKLEQYGRYKPLDVDPSPCRPPVQPFFDFAHISLLSERPVKNLLSRQQFLESDKFRQSI
jgi:predicted acylesterase/phospholipase RssA